MKFTYSIEEEDFEALILTIRTLKTLDKEFKGLMFACVIWLLFIWYQASTLEYSSISYFIVFIIFLLTMKSSQKYMEKINISHMKDILKWEVEIEFFNDYFVSKKLQCETKIFAKEFSFLIVWNLLYFYSNPSMIQIIKLNWEVEKEFVIKWLQTNNIKLHLSKESEIKDYYRKKIFHINYYFIFIFWLFLLISDILSFDWFWYYLNDIFQLCTQSPANTFPCYWIYDIYAVIFSIILIIITIILFIKNIFLLKNPLVIKK